MLDRANDVLGIVLAGEHVGVGHARHGDVLVTFPASIAGIRDAHQFRGKLVTQIALQNPVLNENSLLRIVALVIHIEGTAAPGHGAVIHHGALFAGDTFADESCEC